MPHKHLLFLVILSLISSSFQDVADNKVDSKDESPLAEAAAEILKEQDLANIGGMVNNFIQSGGAKHLVDGVLQHLATGDNANQLLQGLGSLVKSSAGENEANEGKGASKADVNSVELLQNLGTLIGALKGVHQSAEGNTDPSALLQGLGSLLGASNNQRGGSEASALLQGLGSLLGGANREGGSNAASLLQGLGSILGTGNNQGDDNFAPMLQGLGSLLGGNNQGGIDPALVGQMINMFAGSESGEKKGKAKGKKKSAASGKVKGKKVEKARKKDDSFGLDDVLSVASSLFNGKSKEWNVMDFMPMILNTFNAFVGPEAKARADSHSEHAWSLPPILEKLHLFFDNLLHSDMAKQLLFHIGNEKLFKVFSDENGEFSYQKFEELIENHSFRRHWIQQLTEKLVDFLQIIADTEKSNEYLTTGLSIGNAFLKNRGFPKNAVFDPKKPVKTLTNFANYVAKKYLDTRIDSREYVEPLVKYIQELLKMAQESIALRKKPKDLSDKLTDTINMEIIEPITRVNRAYRFIKSEPKCDRYVLCLINQNAATSSETLPGLKKALYKSSSLIAGWFLSSYTGTSYWELYSDIIEDKDCRLFHNEKCDGFHAEEIKVTTEYVHNEL